MLINTKLKTPSLRPRMLFRKDLIQRLCGADGLPLVVVSGPGGSGKTSLICQWPAEDHVASAWYSLDQEDNEPDLFYRYLLTSLIQADEGAKIPFGPMLGGQQQLSGKTVIPLIIEALSEKGKTLRLILDDFHHIENKEILHDLTRLIKYLPAQLQLVILSRHPLPASMGSVAYKKEFLEISAQDLRFSETETEELFRNIIPLSISPAQIRELNSHLEGWAAGLQLIGIEVQSKGNRLDLSHILNQAHEQVAGYLVHDILSAQPEHIRNFVRATALLTRFNPDVCAEITGQNDVTKVLADLERMNLFLIPLDGNGSGQWYRYHHMFSEAVRHQIMIDTPNSITEILRKAATWFAANGHIEDAVRSAFRAGDFVLAADLLEDHIFEYILYENPATGLRWISRLPPSILNPRIYLRLQQCLILLIQMEFSKVKEIVFSVESIADKALQRYSEDKQRLCEDYIILLRCILKMLNTKQSADIPELLSMGRTISPQNSFLESAIDLNAVFAYLTVGDLASAENNLAKLAEDSVSPNFMISKIFIAKAGALIARHRGRLHQAEAIIDRIQHDLDAEGMNDRPEAFFLYRHLGYIFYLQNKLDQARECIDRAARYCEDSGVFEEVMTGNDVQLMLYFAEGNQKQVTDYVKRLHFYSAKFGVPHFSAGLEAITARLAIEEGNLAQAFVWAKQRKVKVNEPFSQLFALEVLLQVRIYLAQKKYHKALDLLKPLRDRCQKRDLLELVLHSDILRSAVFYALNRHDRARAILADALAFSETEGYVRPFVNHARYIAPVLKDIAARKNGSSLSSHLERVIRDCHITVRRPAFENGDEILVQEDLSKREIEILEWMALGFLNKEIAQKTSISINTVKTHVRRILSKLGVRTRTQAVVKAKEMKVI